MKITILLIFLLLCGRSWAQKVGDLDTVLVYRLIADTTYQSALESYSSAWVHHVYYAHVLEIREYHSSNDGQFDPYAAFGYHEKIYPKHLKYLTCDKEPLPKSIIIIETL
jgi:hypothetical protein